MIQAILGHLWQSTLFAGAAYVIALALRPNRAESRYWVWFAASVKFLIPFSLLVALGNHIPHRPTPTARTGWVAAFQDLSQPFALSEAAQPVAVSAHPISHFNLLTAVAVLWACGFVAVAIFWLLRWRRIRTLRNSARVVNIPTSLSVPVPVMSAPDLVEPGVAGILKPVLLLPEGIAERISPIQLDAILAHEFCHVRRRDNLTAAIHMAVQAVFWFHPLTWWIGTRLVAERERACDEEVLRGGCKASVYAESLLAVCRLYLASPLACVSGVTGSSLQGRIEAIMRNRNVIALSLRKRLMLTGAGLAALVLPLITGALSAPAVRAQDAADWETRAGGKMSFDVASIKLSTEERNGPLSIPLDPGDRFQPTGGYFRVDVSLWSYIQFAYKLWSPGKDQREVIDHLPKWVTTENYSVEARAAGDPTKDQYRLMVQSLLADRFHLAAHFETREAQVYAITLAKGGKLGPKMIRHEDGRACGAPGDPIGPTPPGLIGGKDDAGPENFPPMCDSLAVIRRRDGTMFLGYRDATMDQLTGSLSGMLGQPLFDQTGLTGRFDFTLAWVSESAEPQDPIGPTTPLDALRDQLGMKVESTKGPVKVLVVDRVERPSEN